MANEPTENEMKEFLQKMDTGFLSGYMRGLSSIIDHMLVVNIYMNTKLQLIIHIL